MANVKKDFDYYSKKFNSFSREYYRRTIMETAAKDVLSGKEKFSVKMFHYRMAQKKVQTYAKGGGHYQEWSFDVIREFVLEKLHYKIEKINEKEFFIKKKKKIIKKTIVKEVWEWVAWVIT